jgi:RecB family exonuclease
LAEGKLYSAASFPALEAGLTRELESLRQRAAGSVWVLMPTNLLALHLRRTVAGAAGGICGVDFLTLKDAARRVALPQLARQGLRPLPAGAEQLTMRRLLDDVPDDSYFAEVRGFLNAAPVVLRALSVLRNGLWNPEALRDAASSAQFRDAGAPRRLRELAHLWSSLREWKRDVARFTDDDLILAAGREDTAAAERPGILLIYGFYDFTPAQQALVGRLAALADGCSAFLLWAGPPEEPAPGFEYAGSTAQWLRRVLNAPEVETLSGPEDRNTTQLGALTERLFAEQPIMEPEETERRLAAPSDGTVRVLSCPGEEPEAFEVAREGFRTADEGDEPASVGVLLRGAEGVSELLDEALARAGVARYMREGLPLAETPAGRVALALLDLMVGDARRGDIIDFLGLAQIDMPEGLSATALDRLSRQAGLVKGAESWVPRLREMAERLTEEARHADTEAEESAHGREAQLCQAAAGFLEDFFARLTAFDDGLWRTAAGRLRAMVAEWAPESGRADVLECIEGLGELDVCGLRATPRRVRWLLGGILGQKSRTIGGFQRAGLTVSTVMAARGVSFDTVIIPGLVEKGFPRHIPEQPLLTELDREALNEVAAQVGCGALPLQRRRPDEERYLFRLAVGSARRVVVLTYPRLDQDKGRPRMPSRFLGRVASALAGCEVRASALERGFPSEWFRWVPLNGADWTEEDAALALDESEYDAAVYSGGQVPRTAYMAAVSEHYARALRMEKARWHTGEFGPYDGDIRAPDLLESLRQQHGRFHHPVAPTRFETYAECPFRYFLDYVLGVEEIEEPAEELLLRPGDYGTLVHDLLKELYRQFLQGRRLGRLDDEQIEEALGLADRILDELGAAHAENRPAPWAAEREKILATVRRALSHEREEHGEATPELFEYSFARPVTLEDMEIPFRGRMDRVDRRTDGSINVVDYKTGKSSGYKEGEFKGGRQLQLPVYLLAAADELQAEEGSARYFFVSEPKDVRQFSLEELRPRLDDLRRILRLVTEGICGGNFFPMPDESRESQTYCERYCPYGSVCGPARQDLADFKAVGRQTDKLRELRSIE